MCRKCPFLGLTTKSSSCWGDSRSLPRTIESKRWADVVADSSFKCSARVWQRKFRIRDWISREYCRLRYPPPPPLHPGLPTSIVLLLVVVASPYVTKFHPFFAVRADKQEKYSHNSAMSPRSFGRLLILVAPLSGHIKSLVQSHSSTSSHLLSGVNFQFDTQCSPVSGNFIYWTADVVSVINSSSVGSGWISV